MTEALPAVAISGIHHFAYKCRNAEETRKFYQEVLGLPLIMVLEADNVTTTTGETLSFIHFFFEMGDGNYVAFFDFGDGLAPQLDDATPKFANHLAFRLKDEAELAQACRRLDEFNVSYQGPMEHDFVRSIYFWDPNGVRLEYAYTMFGADKMAAYRESAPAALERWTAKVNQKQKEQQLA
jgi:catechol 2,3-dioxygenase-like lactoylglutathione lyase family enzyme